MPPGNGPGGNGSRRDPMFEPVQNVRTLLAATPRCPAGENPGRGHQQGWAKLVLIALERYSVALKRLTFNFR